MQIAEYLDDAGASPFGSWFDTLNPQAAAKITVALGRMQQGNLGNSKSVGGGVLEWRVDFGPGYRVYFGREGDRIIVLLGGGSKRRQQQDISAALGRWQDYKRRKKEGGAGWR